MQGVRFRGATTIHTRRFCQHWSLGSWEIAADSICVNGLFLRRVVSKEDITEIRMVQKPTPEFALICSSKDQPAIYRLSKILASSGRRLSHCLEDYGYEVDQIFRRAPQDKSKREQEALGLAPDSP